MADTSKKRFLVDTNILVYSLDRSSPFQKLAVEFFRLCEQGEFKGAVAHQNVIELINTLIRDYKISNRESLKKTRVLIDEGVLEIIFPLPTTLGRFFDLAGKYKGKTFDLYLAATALDNGVEGIITNNPKDFEFISGFKVLTLGELKKFEDVKP